MENQSSAALEFLQGIVEVIQTNSTNEVNRYLELGWKVIGLSTSQYMESTSLHYHLCWRGNLGEPQKPEPDSDPFKS